MNRGPLTKAPMAAPAIGDLVLPGHVDKHFGALHVLRDINLPVVSPQPGRGTGD